MNTDRNSSLAGFLRLPDVLSLIPVSRSAWWSGVKDGRFPKPVKLSARTTAWRHEDIQALIARLSGSNADDKSAVASGMLKSPEASI